MKSNERSDTKQLLVGIAGAVAVIIIAFAIWELALSKMTIEEEYRIDIWLEGEKSGHITMSQLKSLDTVSYTDTFSQSGAIDEGPLLMDVISLFVNNSTLGNDTLIQIWSDLTLEERVLSWEDVTNLSNPYILDFTKRGTTKLTSPETPRNDRVRDVTDILIGG